MFSTGILILLGFSLVGLYYSGKDYWYWRKQEKLRQKLMERFNKAEQYFEDFK